MITKSRIVGLLLILGVSFLVFRPGEKPSDSDDRGSDSKSATDQQFQPSEPAFLTPERDYGVAGQPGIQEASPSYGGSNSYPRRPYPQGYSSGYGAPRPYDGQDPIPTNGYRFRPLNKQEQSRMQTSYPDQYRAPHYSAHSAQQQPLAPAPYSTPYMRPDEQQEIYSFRPLEKSSTPRGRWQGPYQQPGWRNDRPAIDSWSAPSNPQWGSTPPTQRMYPSYSRNTGRYITAR